MRKAAAACRLFLSYYDNFNYRCDVNGELFVLKTLSRFPLRTIFDVGANTGCWSRAAASCFPGATIHSFEICADTFRELQRETAGLNAVRCVNTGLAERDATVRLHYYEQNSTLTTIFDFPLDARTRVLEAPVQTGSGYCGQTGVNHIDFLNIDVEGMEHLVLQGLSEMFERSAVDVVQFEYGRYSIQSRFLLRDFYEWFEPRGFVVGKIYPTYVDFHTYAFEEENFLGPNYLACRKSRPEYITALRGSDS